MIKVAYLLGSLNRGGTETLLYDLFRRHDAVPYDMICLHRKNGAFQEEYYQTGVPMYQLNPQRGRYLTYIYKLRKRLLTEHVTHVHAQQYLDALYAYLACIGTSIQIVETFHGYDFKAGKLVSCMIKLSMRWVDKVCFVSAAEKRYYLQKYHIRDNSVKYFVVYNGLNLEKLDVVGDLPKLPTKNRSLARDSGCLKLAMVGNFVSGRSQSSLRQFLLDLHRAGIAYDFYFVGKRNDAEPWRYDDCVRFCEEHDLQEVHFLGARNDVPGILKQLDAFVYATDHDTFGIAVIEAIATGVPTFVNDWEVMREITQEGTLATLYRTNDMVDLFKHFADFMQHQTAYQKAAQQAAKMVRQKYSIETHINRLYELYQV